MSSNLLLELLQIEHGYFGYCNELKHRLESREIRRGYCRVPDSIELKRRLDSRLIRYGYCIELKRHLDSRLIRYGYCRISVSSSNAVYIHGRSGTVTVGLLY